MSYVDIGKAHIRARLYNVIPGVIRDVEKMRKNFCLSIGLSEGTEAKTSSYNITTLLAKSKNGQDTLSGCVITTPIYEPISNFILEDTNTSSENYKDVYWKVVKATNTCVSNNVNFYLKKKPNLLFESKQLWGSQKESVKSEYYSEDEYGVNQIVYTGTGSDEKGKEFPASSSSSSNNSVSGVDEIETISFVVQKEAAPDVWWGIETVSPFKGKGHPFWVTIKPQAISKLSKDASDGKSVIPFISIVLNEGDTDYPYVELNIESTGNCFVVYKKSGVEDYSTEQIPTSWITDSFNVGGEIKIGFMSVMGRLCIYNSPDRYHCLTMIDENGTLLKFNLNTPKLSIFGYGCKVSLSAFNMTFKKRGWMTLPGMKNESYVGRTFPDKDEAGVRKGESSDGLLVSLGMPLDGQQSVAKKGVKNKMYGAVFSEYAEIDFSVENTRERETRTTKRITESDLNTGIINPFGKIHIVRTEGKKNDSEKSDNEKKTNDKKTKSRSPSLNGGKSFWYVYLETKELDSDVFTPAGEKVDAATLKKKGVTSSRGYGGFPTFYSIAAVKPSKIDGTLPEDDNFVDVSGDLVSFSCSHQLDSNRPMYIESSGSIKLFNVDGKYSDYLAKARGVKVWLKWSPNENVTFDDSDIAFSGIAFGRTGSYSPGEEYVTFECQDHWKVLEGMQIKNSPYYDGFYVYSVVEDLCDRAGMSTIDDVDKSQAKQGGPMYYYLGQGLAYDKPMFRFSSETSIKDCIFAVMKGYELYLYFDKNGLLHMAPVPGGFQFSHINSAWDPDVKDTYYTELGQTSSPFNFIIDGLEMTSTLSSSVFNAISVTSIDRSSGYPLAISRGIVDSLTDPNSVGYLGFVKECRFDRADLGDIDAANKYANQLKEMFGRPGYEIEFNTIGHIPKMRAGQFIRLKKNEEDDNVDLFKKKLRVTRFSQNYEASGNLWKTSIGGFQIVQPSDGFSPTRDIPSEKPADPDAEEVE